MEESALPTGGTQGRHFHFSTPFEDMKGPLPVETLFSFVAAALCYLTHVVLSNRVILTCNESIRLLMPEPAEDPPKLYLRFLVIKRGFSLY